MPGNDETLVLSIERVVDQLEQLIARDEIRLAALEQQWFGGFLPVASVTVTFIINGCGSTGSNAVSGPTLCTDPALVEVLDPGGGVVASGFTTLSGIISSVDLTVPSGTNYTVRVSHPYPGFVTVTDSPVSIIANGFLYTYRLGIDPGYSCTTYPWPIPKLGMEISDTSLGVSALPFSIWSGNWNTTTINAPYGGCAGGGCGPQPMNPVSYVWPPATYAGQTNYKANGITECPDPFGLNTGVAWTGTVTVLGEIFTLTNYSLQMRVNPGAPWNRTIYCPDTVITVSLTAGAGPH